MNFNFDKKFVQLKTAFENELISFLAGRQFDGKLNEAIPYALMSGGKRLRPIILLSIIEDFGKEIDNDAMLLAIGVELLHTYTLIHDDLPCMDDDNYRRGHLTVHKKFDYATALLAGDALHSLAFEVFTDVASRHPSMISGIHQFATLIGACGTVGGQQLEYDGCNNSELQIIDIYTKKTSNLFIATCALACKYAETNDKILKLICDFALNLGIAFQLRDDYLDIDGNGLLRFFERDKIGILVNEYTDKAVECLTMSGIDSVFLKKLSFNLIKRNI